MSGRPTALLQTVNLLLNQGPLLTLGLSPVFGLKVIRKMLIYATRCDRLFYFVLKAQFPTYICLKLT